MLLLRLDLNILGDILSQVRTSVSSICMIPYEDLPIGLIFFHTSQIDNHILCL